MTLYKPRGLKQVEERHRQMHKYEMVGKITKSEHAQSCFATQHKRGHAPHVTAPHTTA